jgi:hypothetical protein
MDLWEDDVPWGNMALTALKVGRSSSCLIIEGLCHGEDAGSLCSLCWLAPPHRIKSLNP